MAESFDCIVLGVGGFGGGALDHLARRGLRVLGIERFGVAHDRGSSHGETRIVRKAYFEHPDYVPLLLRAYGQWSDLECDFGKPLMNLCGLMLAGPPGGDAVAGAMLAARRYAVEIEEVGLAEAAQRFAGFTIPTQFAVIYEPEAGYLLVEDCVRAHIERAQRHGAVLQTGELVRTFRSDGKTVRVVTDRGEYTAARLVVTAGAWTSGMLAELQLPLRVVRKPVFWCAVAGKHYTAAAGCPAFYFEMPEGAFYGFPSLDSRTVKVAEHTGGADVHDPSRLFRTIDGVDTAPIGWFIEQVLPGVEPEPVKHSVCMYTHTPDGHFIVDRHPELENVVIGAGFSGHGFKFTTVLGEALADLAIEGRTELPIEFLSIGRAGLSRSATAPE